MWNKLFAGADLMQKGLSVAWTRDHVIRHNIANAETPNFKASEVEFESMLAASLEMSGFHGKTTRDRHIPIRGDNPMSVQPLIHEARDLSMRMDGNNVDIESENTRLAQNSIQYNTLLYKLNSELARIKLAVTEGR